MKQIHLHVALHWDFLKGKYRPTPILGRLTAGVVAAHIAAVHMYMCMRNGRKKAWRGPTKESHGPILGWYLIRWQQTCIGKLGSPEATESYYDHRIKHAGGEKKNFFGSEGDTLEHGATLPPTSVAICCRCLERASVICRWERRVPLLICSDIEVDHRIIESKRIDRIALRI